MTTLNYVPSSIAPGATATFQFKVTAPFTAGFYNFQWRMRKNTEEFGAFSTSVAVAVSKPPANGAAFVSQSVPTGMIAGQSYNVSVSMRNIGTNTWTPGSGYKLGSQNPADNKRWGINRALLSSPVAQGETGTFTFNVVAPATSGNYDFQWRMLQEGISWFGAPTTDLLVPVNVLGDAAAFVSQQVPSTIYAGRTYQVSMTMKNVGSNAWSTVGKYRLGSQNPQDNKVWGVSRADFPTTVAPGDTVTIAFNVTAPAVAGTYNFQWRLVHESVVWFGDLSKNLQLNVAVPPNASSFVQQTVPSNMTAGQTYNVSVTMKNTGTATWTADKLYRLASENPRDNLIWGKKRVPLPAGISVPPGESVTFAFPVKAPVTAGLYNFQWSMIQDGVQWFGQLSSNTAVTVQ